VRREAQLLEDTAEELFEDAPCGYLSTQLDGTIIQVNRTFEAWTGLRRDDLLDRVHFGDLLTPGGRIYYETHYAPLLFMQGAVREIALELVRADGSVLPALVNSVVRVDDSGRPGVIRTTVFDATDRRRYEEELLKATRREREIATQLQRSLLSGELPRSSKLDLGIHYAPAERGAEVGGDWYDAFWVDEGKAIGLVVGDVVGRGIAAASTMGQLRSAVRALASTRLRPGELLEALDAYSDRHEVGAMTTLVYAELVLERGSLCYACAGHLPPILVEPGAAPEVAWEGRSPPLGADFGSEGRDEAERVLAPGATLALYTDGLVERADQPAETGVAKLVEHLALHRDASAGEIVRSAAQELGREAQNDDVCALVVRLAAGD
jgi:PAS domain S-box-containing protein